LGGKGKNPIVRVGRRVIKAGKMLGRKPGGIQE